MIWVGIMNYLKFLMKFINVMLKFCKKDNNDMYYGKMNCISLKR